MKKLNLFIIAVAFLATETAFAQWLPADTINVTGLPFEANQSNKVYMVRNHFPGEQPLYLWANSNDPRQVPPGIRVMSGVSHIVICGEVRGLNTFSTVYMNSEGHFYSGQDSATAFVDLADGVNDVVIRNLWVSNFAIAVRGYNNHNVRVEDARLTCNWHNVDIYNGEDIVVRNCDGSYGSVFYGENVRNCAVENCEFWPFFSELPGVFMQGNGNWTRNTYIEGVSENDGIAFVGDHNTATGNHIISSSFAAIRSGISIVGNHNTVQRDTMENCRWGIYPDGSYNKIVKNELLGNSSGIFARHTLNTEYSGNGGQNVGAGINFWLDDGDQNTMIAGNFGCGNTISGVERVNETGFDGNANRYSIPGNHVNEWSDSLGTVCGMSVTEREFDPAPKEFALEQNYPNPFNPTTTISFSLSHPSSVRLTVCDALGRHVETLVNGRRPAGSYKLVWNGENLASGVYFALLVTDEGAQKIRMTLVK